MDAENKKADIKSKAAEDHIKSIRDNAMKNLEIVSWKLLKLQLNHLRAAK